jgi:hypothetical protein
MGNVAGKVVKGEAPEIEVNITPHTEEEKVEEEEEEERKGGEGGRKGGRKRGREEKEGVLPHVPSAPSASEADERRSRLGVGQDAPLDTLTQVFRRLSLPAILIEHFR